MPLSTRDLFIGVALVVAVVVINFIVLEAELGGEDVEASEIPDLNLTADRFDFAGERPTMPLGPDEHRVSFNETGIANNHNLNDSTVAQATGPTCTYGIQTGIGETGGESETKVGDEEGDTVRIEVENWVAIGELENATTCTWKGEVLESPGGGTGFLEGFIGSTAEAIAGLISGAVFIGETFIWLFLVFVTVIFNVGGLLVDVASFAIGLVSWLFGTYSTVTSAASDWATLALTVPLVGISFLVAKVGLALIEASNWL